MTQAAEPTLVDEVLPGVFSDIDLDRALARDSIALVPMLSPSEIEDLLEAYRRVAPQGETGLMVDYLRTDRSMMRAIAEIVQPIWDRHFPHLFPTRRPVASSFLVKQPGADSTFILHRDLPVLDERRHRNYTLWIPLVDVGPGIDNGGLELAIGTESLDPVSRGLDNMVQFDAYRPYIERNLQPVAVPAGTAAVFDVRIVHGSRSNESQTPRPAFGCLLALQDEPVVQVVPTGRRGRRVFAVDSDFFIEHHPLEIRDHGMPSRYRCIDEYQEYDRDVLPEDLQRALGTVETPTPTPQVPGHISDLAGDAPVRHLEQLDRLPVRCRSDVIVPWDSLDPPSELLQLEVEHCLGRSGVAPWIERGRAAPNRPGWIEPNLLAPDQTAETAFLIVLDAGARLSAPLPSATRTALAWQLSVIECPRVRSGLFTDGAVVQFDLGQRVELREGAPVHVWNEGPGPVVLELRQPRTARPWVRRLVQRVTRQEPALAQPTRAGSGSGDHAEGG